MPKYQLFKMGRKYHFKHSGDLYDRTSIIVADKSLPGHYLNSRAKWCFRINSIGKFYSSINSILF